MERKEIYQYTKIGFEGSRKLQQSWALFTQSEMFLLEGAEI